MRVYGASLETFQHHLLTNELFADLSRECPRVVGFSVSPSEARSWRGSLPRLEGSLRLAGLPRDVYVAIEHSVQKIGWAITVSGLATLFGFSALCVSSFPMISNFGITTVIAVGFSLIGAIVVMPAALVVVDRLQARIEDRREARTGTTS